MNGTENKKEEIRIMKYNNVGEINKQTQGK